jgi:fructose-1,6-bisphosphatase/inositol monophosphatase family enzyme
VIEAIEKIVAETAAAEIVPRRPDPAEVRDFVEPWRAEVVTEADLAAEAAIAPRLRALRDIPVVGEEAAKQDPALLRLARGRDPFWLVDPIDGTAAFAAGREEFGVMVALVEGGETIAATIHLPLAGRTITAERGSGTFENGRRILSGADGDGPLAGTLYTGFFDDEVGDRLAAAASRLGCRTIEPSYAAALEYPAVARGDKDFVLYGRLRPWDHAPGCLIVAEAGGVAALTADAARYRPAAGFGPMLAAHTATGWETVADAIRTARG